MIDNAMRRLLCEAADQAGWDEETMMLHTTRFLDQLACDNHAVEQGFQDNLIEQVAFEVLAGAEPCASASSCANCGEGLDTDGYEEDDDG